MVKSADIFGRKDQIKDFLIAGKLERAIPSLIDLARDIAPDSEDEDNIIAISFEFNRIDKQFENGELSEEVKTNSDITLAEQILQLLGRIIQNVEHGRE